MEFINNGMNPVLVRQKRYDNILANKKHYIFDRKELNNSLIKSIKGCVNLVENTEFSNALAYVELIQLCLDTAKINGFSKDRIMGLVDDTANEIGSYGPWAELLK